MEDNQLNNVNNDRTGGIERAPSPLQSDTNETIPKYDTGNKPKPRTYILLYSRQNANDPTPFNSASGSTGQQLNEPRVLNQICEDGYNSTDVTNYIQSTPRIDKDSILVHAEIDTAPNQQVQSGSAVDKEALVADLANRLMPVINDNIKDQTDFSIRSISEKTDHGIDSLRERMSMEIESFQKDFQKEKKMTLLQVKPLNQQYEEFKIDLQEKLIDFYVRRKTSMPLSPLVPQRDKPLNQLYVAPKLKLVPNGSDNLESQKLITSFKDIFYENDKQTKDIYIQGETGTGKTSLCSKLTTVWSQWHMKSKSSSFEDYFYNVLRSIFGRNLDFTSKCQAINSELDTNQFRDEEIVGKFQFLFLISLGDAQGKYCDIINMIEDQILSYIYGEPRGDKCSFLKDILDKENCLVILDGLDEWSHPHSAQCKLKPKSIPHRHLWRNSTILTTTRHWKLADVRLKDSEIGILFEISGILDPERIVRSAIRCLRSESEVDILTKQFMTYVRDQGLENFLSSPIITMLLISLWYEEKHKGKSRCGVYVDVIALLLGRLQNKSDADENMSHSFRSDENRNTIQRLNCMKGQNITERQIAFLFFCGQFAFNAMCSSDKACLPSYNVNADTHLSHHIQMALDTGILSEYTSFKITNDQTTLRFLHNTRFQDFFAALYVSTHAEESQNLIEALKTIEDVLNVSDLFIFICGMNPEVAKDISKQAMGKLSTNLDDKTLQGKKAPVQKMILNGYKEAVLNGHNDPKLSLNHVTCNSLSGDLEDQADKNLTTAYWTDILEENKDKMISIELQEGTVDCSIASFTLLKKPSRCLKMLILKNLKRTALLYLDLSDCKTLEYLTLKYVGVERVKLWPNNIKQCYICGLSETVTSDILSSIASCESKLQRLRIKKCNYACCLWTHLPIICKTLNSLSLESLELDQHDEDFKRACFLPNTSLQKLTLFKYKSNGSLDISECTQIVDIRIWSVDVDSFCIKARMLEKCSIWKTKQRLEKEILLSLKATDSEPKLRSLSVTSCSNPFDLCEVIGTSSKLQELRIESANLGDVTFHAPPAIESVSFIDVSVSEERFSEFVNEITGLNHFVKINLEVKDPLLQLAKAFLDGKDNVEIRDGSRRSIIGINYDKQ